MLSRNIFRPLRGLSRVTTIGVNRRLYSSDSTEKIIYSPVRELAPHSNDNYVENITADFHKYEKKVALESSFTGETTTFGELKDQIARWGGYITSKGFQKGDVIAVMSPNVIEYTPIVLGNGKVGVATSTVNPTGTPEEVAYQLQDSDAKMVVVFSMFEPVVQEALALIKKDLPLVAVGFPSPSGTPFAMDIMKDKNIPFAKTLEVGPDHPFSLMYSSGTTGRPKGALVSHGASCAQLTMFDSSVFRPEIDNTGDFQRRFVMILPVFHVAGLHGLHSMGLFYGFKQVMMPKFDPDSYLDTLADYQVTELQVAPALLNFLNSHPGANKDTLKNIRTLCCGTAPLLPSSKDEFMKKIDKEISFQQVYGMTEILACAIDTVAEQRSGYVGKLLPGVTGKVVDAKDGKTTLPPNTPGELLIKTPCAMTRYLNRPEETANLVDPDGYTRTGDVGLYDEEGFIKIVDRTKDLIKVKGFQVSPTEVEEVIMQLPEVADASVIGVPNERLGEAPMAFVVARSKISPDKIQEIVGKKLSKHKQLVGGIKFIEALPRNTTGKVLKKDLEQMAKEK